MTPGLRAAPTRPGLLRRSPDGAAQRPLPQARPASTWRSFPALLGTALAGAGSLGCPQLSVDDFTTGTTAGAGGDAGSSGAPMAGSGPGGGGGSTSTGGVANGGSTASGGGGGSAGSGGSTPAAGAAGAGQAGSGSGASGGTGPAEPCEHFLPPVLLAELDLGAALWGPALSHDALTLYFAVDSGAAQGELYRATRQDRASPFSSPQPIAELNTWNDEGTPHLSGDGRTLYFFSDRAGAGDPDLWGATDDSLSGTFAAPELVDVSSADADFSPWVSADGLRLLFGSYRPGSAGASDLWVAERASLDASFAAPAPLSEVNTPAREETASLSEDGLSLLFTSDREDPSRGLDIWFTSRYNLESAFSPPERLDVLSSAANDADVHLSRDGREVFFSSARTGSQRLWRAERCP